MEKWKQVSWKAILERMLEEDSSMEFPGMERICCSTTLKATGTWVSGGRGYSRVLEHSLGVTKHQKGLASAQCGPLGI